MTATDIDPHLIADPEVNPFASPRTEPKGKAGQHSSKSPSWLRWAWPLAIILHLPVPVWYGCQVTSPDLARLGMLFGVATVYWIGHRLCLCCPWLMQRLAVGAMMTSVSQFWPVGQMWIGYWALSTSEVLAISPLSSAGNIGSVPMIFLATILTGLGLIIPSLIIGIVAVQVYNEVVATD